MSPKLLIACSLLAGLFLPTSSSGVRTTLLFFVGYGAALLLALALPLVPHQRLPRLLFLISVPMVLLFTFTSGIQAYAIGQLCPYIVMPLLFSSQIPALDDTRWMQRLFTAGSILLLVLCLGILVGIPPIQNFVIAHYSMFYDELVPGMIKLHKPVATFATHSIAGFFLYIFFWFSIKSYRAGWGLRFLILSLLFSGMTLALTSVTGLLLFVVELFQLIWLLPIRRIMFSMAVPAAAACIFVVLGYAHIGSLVAAASESTDVAKVVLTSGDNGFIGRWSREGILAPDIEYISAHPLSPIGVAFKAEFNVTDSGIVEHFLRGSLILLVLVYGGLWWFLRNNLSRKTSIVFFCLIIGFETGFSSLSYFRTLILLPFLVAYLRSLEPSLDLSRSAVGYQASISAGEGMSPPESFA